MKKDVIASFCRFSCCWNENSNARPKSSWMWESIQSENRNAALMGKRFDVVPLRSIRLQCVTMDSSALQDTMRDFLYGVRCKEDRVHLRKPGDEHENYPSISYVSMRARNNAFTGTMETDGMSMRVNYRGSKKHCPVPPSAAPVTKHGDEKEADPAMQEVHENDIVVLRGRWDHEHRNHRCTQACVRW